METILSQTSFPANKVLFSTKTVLHSRPESELERQVILDVIQSVNGTACLDELLKVIHESLRKILYAENCFVALSDDTTGLMHFEFWIDKYDPTPAPREIGKGFSSYVLRTGQPLLLTEEFKRECYELGLVERSGTSSASWLGVPLVTPTRIIGILVVQHYEDRNAYTQRDLEFLSSIGGQIALAIDRKRSEQAVREANARALREYERLVERIATLGQTLGSARDLTMIFRALRDFAAASVPCDGLVISLYEQEKESRRFAYCWADSKEFDIDTLTSIPVRDGITGRAIKSGSVVIDNDYQVQLRTNGTPVIVGECHEDQQPQSALSAPMMVMGRTVGCIEIQSYERNSYREEHTSAMRMAASLAANAVENVSLIQREQAKEEQLRQSQKIDAIGQLAGGVAHDFNNLLTVISGYAELSLRRLPAEDPVRRNLEEISKAGNRAAGLTRQLLAFSRRQMLQAKVLDLNSVVREMDKMLQRLIGEDVELVTILRSGVGQIKADPGQIEQVLLNLVVNARDALPKGGKITIETCNTVLDETYARKHVSVQPGSYVVLIVSDNGVGMDAKTQERVFDPFFTTKEIGKGTGLGLSTVYGIVKQSEGSVWVYSEVGRGTTFKIYLPRVDNGAEDEKLASVASIVPGGSETILLVEDEDLVRDLSIAILEEAGYKVISATDGDEGLRLCQQFEGRIDLMITDVVMPRMSGRELAEYLKVLRPETEVLYMSGYTDDAIVRHGILEDDMPFIQKPFLPDALALKVRELLEAV